MPRDTAVSRELVFKLCLEALMRDENPTVNAIQRELASQTGSAGGTQVVSKMISEWRKSIAQKLAPRTRAGLPDEVVALSDQLVDRLFEVAMGKAAEAFEADRQALEIERQRLSTEKESAVAEKEAMAQELAEASRTLKETARLLQQEQTRSAGLETRLEGAAQREGDLRAENARLAERAENLEADKERLQADHARQLSEEHTHHLEALEAERTAWTGERKHLHEQTDQLRQASKQREAELEARLKTETAMVETLRAQVVAANQTAGRWQGQVDSLQEQVQSLQEKVASLTEEKARAEAQCAVLEAQRRGDSRGAKKAGSKSTARPSKRNPKGSPSEKAGEPPRAKTGEVVQAEGVHPGQDGDMADRSKLEKMGQRRLME